jgi:flagellar hook assembly protein FlgD
VDLYSPGNLTISNTAITGNAGAPMAIRNGATLSGLTGMTFSGNGVNAIRYRSTTIAASETWKSFGLPYLLDSYVNVAGTSTPVLTLEAGLTVKFRFNSWLDVGNGNPGKLVANGTVKQPILITTDQATVTAGNWYGISFRSNDQSQMSFVTVEGAGINSTLLTAAIKVFAGNHLLNGLILRTNANNALAVVGGSLTVTNSTITGTIKGNTTGHGIALQGGTGIVSLTTISNNAGNAVAVTGGTGHVVQNCALSGNANGVSNSTLSPRVTARLNYWNSPTGPSGSGPGTGQSVSTGVVFDPFLTALPNPAEYVSSFAITSHHFNPVAAPTRWDLASLLPGTWTITIRDSGAIVVRSLTGAGTPVSLAWDGKNGSGVLQPDGKYNYLLETVAAGGIVAAPAKGLLALDRTTGLSISSPGMTETLSNVYRNGSRAFPVTGTVSIADLRNWVLDFGSGTFPGDWTTIGTGTSPVVNATIATWNTTTVSNGLYSVRLSAYDSSGDFITTNITPTVGNFLASSNKYEFNPYSGETISYSSTVPFQVTEKLYLKDKTGQLVRTVTNVQRTAGSYVDAWDGKSDAGSIAPDGPYSFFVDVTDGTRSMTWDQTSDTTTLSIYQHIDQFNIPAFDPFNNKPMTFTYQPYAPGKTTIFLSTLAAAYATTCAAQGVYCLLNDEYQSSKLQTVRWGGVDSTGRYRGDIQLVWVNIKHDNFPKNLVVVFGSPTAVTNLALSPVRTRPSVEPLKIDFDLSVLANGTATVTITFFNQESLSTLRTITLANQGAGHVSTTWDGRADNGMPVAEGAYLVTVIATDSNGSRVTAQLMTVLEY